MADNVLIQKLNTFFGEKVVLLNIVVTLIDKIIKAVKKFLCVRSGNEIF